MLKKERISESELLTRLLEGERQAFDEIFTRYYTSLCAFANLYVKQTEVAENLVQDLMLWLWENRSELQTRGALSHYLFTSAKNRCLTYLSREALRSNRLSDLRSMWPSPSAFPTSTSSRSCARTSAGRSRSCPNPIVRRLK